MMDCRITIGDFALAAEEAVMKYPGAKVVSVGTGSKGGIWYYGLFLATENGEVRLEIPTHKTEGGKENDT